MKNSVVLVVDCIVMVALHTASTIEKDMSRMYPLTEVSFSCVEIQPNTKYCSFGNIKNSFSPKPQVSTTLVCVLFSYSERNFQANDKIS